MSAGPPPSVSVGGALGNVVGERAPSITVFMDPRLTHYYRIWPRRIIYGAHLAVYEWQEPRVLQRGSPMAGSRCVVSIAGERHESLNRLVSDQ